MATVAPRIDSVQTSEEDLERIRRNYQKKSSWPVSRIVQKVFFWLLIAFILVY
nr:hypothetical protein [Chloroflexia bacterium]